MVLRLFKVPRAQSHVAEDGRSKGDLAPPGTLVHAASSVLGLDTRRTLRPRGSQPRSHLAGEETQAQSDTSRASQPAGGKARPGSRSC